MKPRPTFAKTRILTSTAAALLFFSSAPTRAIAAKGDPVKKPELTKPKIIDSTTRFFELRRAQKTGRKTKVGNNSSQKRETPLLPKEPFLSIAQLNLLRLLEKNPNLKLASIEQLTPCYLKGRRIDGTPFEHFFSPGSDVPTGSIIESSRAHVIMKDPSGQRREIFFPPVSPSQVNFLGNSIKLLNLDDSN